MGNAGRDMGLPLAAGLRAARQALVDLVLPQQCLACGLPVASNGSLCAGCWGTMRLIAPPYCERLGTPFAHDHGPGALSPAAIADPPPFGRLRAVAVYDDTARRLVQGLKYRDRMELAGAMAGWMARAGAQLLAAAEVVVPVPLHWRRLWTRRFNQSAALAQALARCGDRIYAPTALRRVRATRQQVGLSGSERADNVRGAFRVAETERAAVAGRRVLLVDDVYTTGATVKAATRALLRAGAASVDVLVFAQVVPGVDCILYDCLI
jgi:ComF family protein